MQERAPPRGVAVATIATLLESLRCPQPPTLRPPGQMVRALGAAHADKATNTLSVGDNHWHHESNGGARIVITDDEDKESLKKLRKCLEKCPTLAAAPPNPRPPKRPNINGMENLSIDVDTKSCDLDFAELQLECMCSSDSVTESPTLRHNPAGNSGHVPAADDAGVCGCEDDNCKCREGVSNCSRSTTNSAKHGQTDSPNSPNSEDKTSCRPGDTNEVHEDCSEAAEEVRDGEDEEESSGSERGGKQNKSTDSSKLILDLNDRSKFTKEVSV